jgi:hypothetical protein
MEKLLWLKLGLLFAGYMKDEHRWLDGASGNLCARGADAVRLGSDLLNAD